MEKMTFDIPEIKPVRIGGREFKLAFPLKAMLDIRKVIEGFDGSDFSILTKTPENILETLYIMAVNGALVNGEKLDVDKEWFAVHIPIGQKKIVGIQIAIIETIAKWNVMESENNEREEEIDLVLRELQKKREKTDSPGENTSNTD